MGLLVSGKWQDKWYDTKEHGGQFVRQESSFHGQIDDHSEFKPEPNRYHLYVSLACPWAHRTLIFRQLKELTELIPITVVHPLMLEKGWMLRDDNGISVDPLYHFDYLYQLYTKAKPDYTGRVTVPVLWDKHNEIIVNNESSEIIRIFNRAFNPLTGNEDDYYPKSLHREINTLNEMIYHNINNGVYKCGFATSQVAYEAAFISLFDAMDAVEDILQKRPYLVGDQLTEADWRLFTTLIRFDAVYHGHFKCNLKRLVDYPAMFDYVKKLYQIANIADTVHFDHIKQHYYVSHKQINPTQIVPMGPKNAFI